MHPTKTKKLSRFLHTIVKNVKTNLFVLKTANGKNWTRGHLSRLPFAIKVVLNLSIAAYPKWIQAYSATETLPWVNHKINYTSCKQLTTRVWGQRCQITSRRVEIIYFSQFSDLILKVK